MDEIIFSKWENWSDINENKNYQGPAFYAVRLLIDGVVVPIPRFLGVDSEGLLTIGMTTNLEKRRRQFMQGIKMGKGHSAGNLLYKLMGLNSLFKNTRSNASFEISFTKVPNKQVALEYESKSTNEYFERFGEVPPLASVLPDRYSYRKNG